MTTHRFDPSRPPATFRTKVEKAHNTLKNIAFELNVCKRDIKRDLCEVSRRVEELRTKELTACDLEVIAVFEDALQEIRRSCSLGVLMAASDVVNRHARAGGHFTVVLLKATTITPSVVARLAGISPAEAKELVAHLPAPFMMGVSATAALEIKEFLERGGATVEIKQLAVA